MNNRNQQLSYIHESPPLVPPVSFSIRVLYLVTKTWWDQWAEFAGYYTSGNGPQPNQINNASINLEKPEPDQYVFLPKVTWRRLRNWYNYDTKRIAFVKNGFPDYNYIQVFIVINGERSREVKVPLWYTVAEFKNRVTKKIKYFCYECKFFVNYSGGMKILLEDDAITLKKLEFFNDIEVEVEVKSKSDERIVSFSGVLNYNDDQDLERAIQESNKEPQRNVIDYEKVLEVKLKLADLAQEKKYRICIQPIKVLIENVDRILNEKMKVFEIKNLDQVNRVEVRI